MYVSKSKPKTVHTAESLAALVLLFVYGETNGTLVSSGETRHYLLYVPRSYNPAAATPASAVCAAST